MNDALNGVGMGAGGGAGAFALAAGQDIGPDGKRLDKDTMRLKNACYEFESVLSSTILKEGLKSAKQLSESDDDAKDNGSEMFLELANEQMANHLGRQGILGIGDMLFQKINEERKSITKSPIFNESARNMVLNHNQSAM